MSDQLDKILALADSAHDSEALSAVRKARQMLSRDGLSFGDLARVAQSGRAQPKGATRWGRLFSASGAPKDRTESQIHFLRQHIQDLQAQMQTQDLQLGFWRRRAGDLEQRLAQAADVLNDTIEANESKEFSLRQVQK